MEYKWKSSKNTKAIMESAAEQALLQKKIMFPMTFAYRSNSETESEFRLLYDPIGTIRLRFTYTPPGIYGTVKSSGKGSEITAVPYTKRARMCNIAYFVLVIFSLIGGIGALFYDAGLPPVTAVIMVALGFGFFWNFFYTRNKYKDLTRHLEIMNKATGVDYIG